ncbi:MAG: hypothetical protein ACU85V_16460 [Gammaproteobacteria bacterium]
MLFALCLTLAAGAPALAAEDDAGEATPPAAGQPEEKKCVHGCQRWGKHCNVDPRGVRKCRRVCERFGEICE